MKEGKAMIKITYHVDFDFKDREASDLEKLNRILASLKLEKLDLKNSKGYLAVTRDVMIISWKNAMAWTVAH